MITDSDLEGALRTMLRRRAIDIQQVPAGLTSPFDGAPDTTGEHVRRGHGWLLVAATVATVLVVAGAGLGIRDLAAGRHVRPFGPTPIPTSAAAAMCDRGDAYRVTQRSTTFVQIEPTHTMVNSTSSTATRSVKNRVKRTMSRSFSASIPTSLQAAFWEFAKQSSAPATAGTPGLQSSLTIHRNQFTASSDMPGHTTTTVKFGILVYKQYIQQYHQSYNATTQSCEIVVDHAGWVDAPYNEETKFA